MSRPTFEVADMVQAQGNRLVDCHRKWLSYQQLKVLPAIARGRTSALGGHLDSCSRCGHQAIPYNSCRNRYCPKCQGQARQHWLAAREQELLDVSYFHVGLTLPHELNALVRANPALLYDLLFSASAKTLLEVAADPKHLWRGDWVLQHPAYLGTEPDVASAFTLRDSALAAFQRIINGGPLPLSLLFASQGVEPCLSRKVRYRIEAGLPPQAVAPGWRASTSTTAEVLRSLLEDAVSSRLGRLCQALLRRAKSVLRYLGRYTHRVAISNQRLLDFDGESVTFRWKDYAHGNKQKKMTLTATKSLRRFVQHILPLGLVRIRYFGFLANPWRARLIPWCRQLQANAPPSLPSTQIAIQATATWLCPRCGSVMLICERLTAQQLASRYAAIDTS